MNKTLLSLSLTVLTVVPSSAQEHLQRDYMTLNTTYIYLNRHAISGGLPIAR